MSTAKVYYSMLGNSGMIVEITDSNEKQAIARKVLEALADWFEIEESREEYISGCVDWTFFAAKEGEEAVGFLCLKETGKATVELAVMGVYEDYDKTNLFYISCGFKELEVFPLLWDDANPCQIYVMSLK